MAGLMKNISVLKAVEIGNKVACKKVENKGAQVNIGDFNSLF